VGWGIALFYVVAGSRCFLDQTIFARKAAARVAVSSSGMIRATGNSGITSISPGFFGFKGMGSPNPSNAFVHVLSNVRVELPTILPLNVIRAAVPLPVYVGTPAFQTMLYLNMPGTDASVSTRSEAAGAT